jgi:hypothetical protein
LSPPLLVVLDYGRAGGPVRLTMSSRCDFRLWRIEMHEAGRAAIRTPRRLPRGPTRARRHGVEPGATSGRSGQAEATTRARESSGASAARRCSRTRDNSPAAPLQTSPSRARARPETCPTRRRQAAGASRSGRPAWSPSPSASPPRASRRIPSCPSSCESWEQPWRPTLRPQSDGGAGFSVCGRLTDRRGGKGSGVATPDLFPVRPRCVGGRAEQSPPLRPLRQGA